MARLLYKCRCTDVDTMVSPGGKAANMAKQPKKRRQIYRDDHLKEGATTNKRKPEPGEGWVRAMEQKHGGEGAAELLL